MQQILLISAEIMQKRLMIKGMILKMWIKKSPLMDFFVVSEQGLYVDEGGRSENSHSPPPILFVPHLCHIRIENNGK